MKITDEIDQLEDNVLRLNEFSQLTSMYLVDTS